MANECCVCQSAKSYFVEDLENYDGLVVKVDEIANPDWRPIDTAPKGGTVILLATSIGVVATAWNESGYFGSGYCEYDCATHWMPLPPAPDNNTGKEGRR